MKIIKEERGSLSFVGILFLYIVVSFMSILIIKKLDYIKKQTSHFKAYLCVKEANLHLTQHQKRILQANNVIIAANLGKSVGLITNPAILLTASRAKKLSQIYQDFQHFSFLKKISKLYTRGCSFTSSVAKTSFKTQRGIKLQRSKLGLTLKRRRNWDYKLIQKDILIKTTFPSNDSKKHQTQVTTF